MKSMMTTSTKRKFILLGSILLVLLGLTWIINNVLKPDEAEAYTTLRERWLRGEPCRPPCWEEITPGQTSAADAKNILNNNPWVGSLNEDESNQEIYWDWTFSSTGGGRMFYDSADPNKTINTIGLGFGPAGWYLGDIIRAYGEPSHVWATEIVRFIEEPNPTAPPWKKYDFELIWLDQGFLVRGDFDEVTPRLSEATRVVSPILFVPGFQGYSVYHADTKIKLALWHGYDHIAVYCTQLCLP